jgi:tRNA threonylcarbamoyladenosine modification (KEOPS) complex Cgi121 subunit
MRRQIRQSHKIGNVTTGDRACVSIISDLARIRQKMRSILKEKPIEDWSLDEICAFKADLEPVLSLAAEVDRQLQKLSA